jgi:hypothetical protein
MNEVSEKSKIETSEVLIKMLLDKNPQLLPLLMYVKQHEDDIKGVSKQKVVNYMNKEDLSSKVTTTTMINALLNTKILIDTSNRSYQSTLKINPSFDFYGLLWDVIYYKLAGLEKILKPIEGLDKKVKLDFKQSKEKGKDKFEITLTPTVS